MKVNEAIIKFLNQFVDDCVINKNEDYVDCVNINHYVEYIFLNISPEKEFLKPFIQCFHETNFEPLELEKEVEEWTNNITKFKLIDFINEVDFKRRYRKFSFSNEIGSYIPIEFLYRLDYFDKESSTIYKEINPDDSVNYKPKSPFKGILDFILKNIESEENIRNFNNAILQKENYKSVLVSRFPDSELISVFSYLYYSYLINGNHTELDEDHKFNKDLDQYHDLTVPDLNKDFSQFIELADVINEANMSPDILTRYLKFYHQLEYLAYRVYLKAIAKNAKEERSFITDLHKLSSSPKSNEEEAFKKSFKDIFQHKKDALKTNFFQIEGDKKEAVIFFAKDRFQITFLETESSEDFLGKFAKFIYKIRNSIVHNKESEFHLTVTKIDSYPILKYIIPWIINNIEFEIDNLLRIFSENIKYEDRTISLY